MNTDRNKDRWDSLSMKEKSEMMKAAVQQGIYNLSDIRKVYNEYAEGGPENNGNPRSITTGGAGYIPSNYGQGMLDQLRQNIYENVDPSENYPQSISELINRVTGTIDRHPVKENPEIFKNKDMVWAQYLNIPLEKRHYKGKLKESPYLPTQGNVKKAYELDLSDNEKELLINEHFKAPMNGNINSSYLNSYINTGTYTVGRGYDPYKGQYASLYDRWDINPFRGKDGMKSSTASFLGLDKLGDISLGIGTPVELYNRIYLDDYYDIPDNKKGSYFLPEVTVYPNEESLGGPLVQLANKYEEGGPTDESNNIVDWIIGEEGFSSRPENIGDGKITLGSGLTASKWHKIYNKKGTWTAEDNRAAVTEEVENRRKWAEQNVPNWGELPEDSQNALLSYKYNYNFTPKNSPKLFKALEDRNYEEAARQMDATSSNPRFRKGLQARRQREQEMFMRGINSMNAPEPEVVEEIPQEESIYTPPQRVLDNMAAHNGRYMIMGNPPLAGVRNTVLDALRRLKALNLFVEGGPLVDLANKTL